MGRTRVLISEDIPANNKGEAALFYGLVESLGCIADKDIVLLSTEPEADNKYYGHLAEIVDARGIIPAHIVSGKGSLLIKGLNYFMFIFKQFSFVLAYKVFGRLSFVLFNRQVWKEYVIADAVIMGHDSFWSPLYHATMLTVFKNFKKPCFVYAGSVSPSNPDRKSGLFKKVAESISRYGLKKARLVTLRERISERKLRTIGLSDDVVKIEVYPDLAFLVPPENKSRIDEILSEVGIKSDDRLIGMAFNRRTLRQAYPGAGNDEYRLQKAIEDISVLAQMVKDKYSAKIIFIPHSIGPEDNLDDRIIARAIIENMKDSSNVISLEGDYWVQELKGIASRLDMAVSSRLHFCIDALSSEVPALFVTYARDIRGHGIIGEMMDRPEYLYNIDEMNEVSDLLERVDTFWNDRDQTRHDLEQQLPQMREDTRKHGSRLYEEYSSECVK